MAHDRFSTLEYRRPLVDVVIPWHDASRDVEAAVESASTSRQGLQTRVLLVLHNMTVPEERLRALGEKATILRCDDGDRSPSGPRNVGIDAATAEFVFFLDSDDLLARRCLARLRRRADEVGADVVLPAMVRSHRVVSTPPARPHDGVLDLECDALPYRSSCLALIRRSFLAETGIRLPEHVPTNEDLVFMLELYARGAVVFEPAGRYVVQDPPGGRVTSDTVRSSDRLRSIRLILESEHFGEWNSTLRELVVLRLLTINVLGSWKQWAGTAGAHDLATYRAASDALIATSPGVTSLLSVRDRYLLGLPAPTHWLWRVLSGRALGAIPTTVRGAISRHGPPRLTARSFLTVVRSRLAARLADRRELRAGVT